MKIVICLVLLRLSLAFASPTVGPVDAQSLNWALGIPGKRIRKWKPCFTKHCQLFQILFDKLLSLTIYFQPHKVLHVQEIGTAQLILVVTEENVKILVSHLVVEQMLNVKYKIIKLLVSVLLDFWVTLL